MDASIVSVGSLRDARRFRLILCAYAVSFGLPLILRQSQWVTGTLVNCLLFMASARMTGRERAGLYILPSLAALLGNVLFGPHTVFLYYFLPFIWSANFVLVETTVRMRKFPMPVRVLAASLGKYTILSVAALAYVRLRIVPPPFAVSMGGIQLATALAGGMLAWVLTAVLSIAYERTNRTD